MTRRDYVLLAETIRHSLEECDTEEQVWTVEAVRDRIARALSDDNPRFDTARFVEACEVL